MRSPSPAFQFYPKDWLSDGRVREMTHEQRGIYMDLLSIYWLEGGLPADEGRLARLAGVRPARFRKLSHGILACFESVNGMLVQRRLDGEKLKQEEFRNEQARKGSIGGKSRVSNEPAKPRINPGQADAQAGAKPEPSFPVPYPSSLSLNGNRQNEQAAKTFVPSIWYKTPADRIRAETESQRLCREIADLTGRDGIEVWDQGQDVPSRPGALPIRRKLNPAAMTPDRLANTILDLRKTLESAKREAEMKRAREATQARQEAEKPR